MIDRAVVVSPILPLKVEPRFDCELADEALYGMVVDILDISGNWAYVRTPYRYEGWAPMSGLLCAPSLVSAWEGLEKKVVLRSFADVMHEPKVQSYPYVTLPRGALAPVEGAGDVGENGWCLVTLANGSKGYARSCWFGEHKTAYDASQEDALRAQLVDAAKSYLGTQYRWGGKTCEGIDCSGLCSMAYLLCGSVIYRDAAIRDGFDMHKIPYEALKPGDLMFFKGHVAMYLGNDTIIHSTGHAGDDGVVINSLRKEEANNRADLLDILLYCGSLF